MKMANSIRQMTYGEKQHYYKSLVNRENGPVFPERKRTPLKENVMTERLIQHIDLLPKIQSQKVINADLLRQLFELTEAKKQSEKEAKRLSEELDIANSCIRKLKDNNKSHREKLLQFDEADKANAEYIQKLEKKNKNLKKKA